MDIILSGCTGSMGKVITEVVKETDHKIVAGVAKAKRNGRDYPIYNDINFINEGEVIIDFSSYENLRSILDYALGVNMPVVLATTGYSDEDLAHIKEASRTIPILYSQNMSIGVNVMESVVKELSKSLEGFDIEIVEKHHNKKADTPSGTARMLFNAANEGREERLFELDGRSGLNLKRDENEVGIHGVRGGSIVGEHTVIFAGLDEVIEIKHTAYSKKIFAQGAIKAAEFISSKKSGLYSMKDVF